MRWPEGVPRHAPISSEETLSEQDALLMRCDFADSAVS
jgi:hypothetical protein